MFENLYLRTGDAAGVNRAADTAATSSDEAFRGESRQPGGMFCRARLPAVPITSRVGPALAAGGFGDAHNGRTRDSHTLSSRQRQRLLGRSGRPAGGFAHRGKGKPMMWGRPMRPQSGQMLGSGVALVLGQAILRI